MATPQTEEEWAARLRSIRDNMTLSRSSAWLPYDQINGRLVAHFSPRIWLFLQSGENAFVFGDRIPMAGDVAQFLWAVRPDGEIYTRPDKRFLREVAALDWRETLSGIQEYLNRQLVDLPASDGGGSKRMPVAHWSAYWVHRYGELYGWEIDYTLSQSVSRLCQLDKVDRVANKDGTGFVDAYTTAMTEWLDWQKEQKHG